MIKNLSKGDSVVLDSLDKKAHKTSPPPRFSETKLVAELEKRGIGRPATFSSIVSVIQERGYVRKIKGQQLAPTFLGFAVIKLLTRKFPKYTDYDYTSSMEKELEDVQEGSNTRVKILSDFWKGSNGFENFMKNLNESIDWDEIRDATTLDLNNGYSIITNKYGSFLRDDNGEINEKGRLPSVKIDDEALAEEFTDKNFCRKLIESNKRKSSNGKVLGVLSEGPYKDWSVSVREGRYGPFLQAADGRGKNVNQKLPEEYTVDKVSFSNIKSLFSEIKLPRWSDDNKWVIGVGSRGPYVGRKKTDKSKKVDFKSLPENVNPREISWDEAKKIWNES